MTQLVSRSFVALALAGLLSCAEKTPAPAMDGTKEAAKAPVAEEQPPVAEAAPAETPIAAEEEKAPAAEPAAAEPTKEAAPAAGTAKTAEASTKPAASAPKKTEAAAKPASSDKQASAPVPEPDKKAERLWKSKCAACHGATGAGDTKKGAELKLANMTTAAWQKAWSNEKLRQVTLEGVSKTEGGIKKEMKPYKDTLTSEQVDQLVSYMRWLGAPKK